MYFNYIITRRTGLSFGDETAAELLLGPHLTYTRSEIAVIPQFTSSSSSSSFAAAALLLHFLWDKCNNNNECQCHPIS